MKIRHFQKTRWAVILMAAVFTVFSIYPIQAFAIESITLPVEVVNDDIVSISLPVISESEISVFDFILDPQGLLYETDAVRYGGGRVEEGATLLFYNKEGEYDFSKHSDWLTVTNRSTVPVQVTVTAQVMDFGDIRLTESDDFGENTEPEVYLAIEDDKGNILPLSADEKTTVNLEMSAAPENTYVFSIDEENQTYRYGMSMDPDMVDFDTYSFRLIGACNSNADWRNISIHPTITVTWHVEPIMPEEQEETSEEALAEEENESTTDDDTETEDDVPVDEPDDNNDQDEGNDQDDADGGSDDEKSDDESDEKKDEGDASGSLDDEDQSDNEPGDGDDNNDPGDNEQNEDAESGTTE